MKKFISSTLAAITLSACALPGVKAETMQEHISFIMDSLTKNDYKRDFIGTMDVLNNQLHLTCFARRSGDCLKELNELFEAELKGAYEETYKKMLSEIKNPNERLALEEFNAFLERISKIASDDVLFQQECVFSSYLLNSMDIAPTIYLNSRVNIFRIETFLAFADLLESYRELYSEYNLNSTKARKIVLRCLYACPFFIKPWVEKKLFYGLVPPRNCCRVLLYLVLPEFARVKGIEPLNMESVKKFSEIGECSKNAPIQDLTEVKGRISTWWFGDIMIQDYRNGKCTLSVFKTLIIQEYKNRCSEERMIMDEHLLIQVLDQIKELSGAPQALGAKSRPLIDLF